MWFKVDDSFHAHPKVRAIDPRYRLRASGLWVLAGSWAAQNLTDGDVPREQLFALGYTATSPADRHALAALTDAGLWVPVGSGYQFHDWAEYQKTRAHWQRKRIEDAERVRKYRARRQQEGDSDGHTAEGRSG